MLPAKPAHDPKERPRGNDQRRPPDAATTACHASNVGNSQDRRRYLRAGPPRLRSANDSRPVWTQINLAASNWIVALERLQQHWASGADAAELNQDLVAARAGYDELLLRYNAAVEHQY